MTAETYTSTCPDCHATSRAFGRPGDATRALQVHRCADSCAHCRFALRGGPYYRGLCARCFADPDIRAHYPRITRPACDVVEEVEWVLTYSNGGVIETARSLGLQPESLRRALQRSGRLELFDALADREPDADLRRRTREARRAARTAAAA